MRPLGAPILCRSLQRYLFGWKQVTVKLRHLLESLHAMDLLTGISNAKQAARAGT